MHKVLGDLGKLSPAFAKLARERSRRFSDYYGATPYGM